MLQTWLSFRHLFLFTCYIKADVSERIVSSGMFPAVFYLKRAAAFGFKKKKKKELIRLLPVTVNPVMLRSMQVSSALHQTHPVPTHATLLRMLGSPSKELFLRSSSTILEQVRGQARAASASPFGKMRGS